jgi:hypothetical protein
VINFEITLLAGILKKRQAVFYNVTLRRVRVTIIAVEKAISIAYSECMSIALVIQHAKRTRRIILLSVAWLALPYFSTYLINDTIFRKQSLIIKCVLISSTKVA